MPGGLAALLDDVAAIAKLTAASVDDIGAAAGRAGVKAAGVVVDDTAVTPRYVTGFTPDRELPIIWRIAKGSLRNKLLIILPAALLLSQLPGDYDDWLICMISSQTRHYIPQFDEIIQEHDSDFAQSGLKIASMIRVGRLAVVEGRIQLGAAGQISPERLLRIKNRLAAWIAQV